MTIKVRIDDGRGSPLVAHVHDMRLPTKHSATLTLQERFLKLNPELHPFLNDTFGTAMNQNIAFSGVPEIIHNGGTSTEWTATAVAGTWNFADGGAISLTGANNGDTASFAEEGATTIDMAGFTTLTGVINLTIYNDVQNTLTVQFDLAGVTVGNSVDLDDFIDTGLIGSAQNFIIPKANLGLGTQLVDGFTIVLSRIAGTKPTMTFDDIQLEQTGASAVFKATTPLGTRFHVDLLRVQMSDDVTSIVSAAGTGGSLALPGLSHNTLLSISALTNGIIFQRVQDGKVNFSIILKQLSDILLSGNLVNAISDGTNTMLTIEIPFPEPIILEGGEDNFLSFTINDNLSSLILFNAAARGAIEV